MSLSSWVLQRVRDPVSGFTHLAGALLGAVGLVFLLVKIVPAGHTRSIVSAVVFGVSLILLYLSSAAYHLLDVSEKANRVLRRLDHALIFTLIAGSYTPYCLVTIWSSWGGMLLAFIWGVAVFGFFLSVFWIDAPRWLSTGLYLFMGWFVIFAIRPLYEALSGDAMFWLVAGGIFYTVGAVIYGLKKPDPFPPHFGHHEIWHLLVLAGSACHFISIVYVLT